MKALLNKPLLSGSMCALLLLIANHWWNLSPKDKSVIHITEGHIHAMVVEFEETFNRLPESHELDIVISNYLRDEAIYRTAKQLELDKDDAVIRRYLRQKLEFVSDSFSDHPAPTHEVLQEFIHSDPERFIEPYFYSFEHVLLSTASHKDLAFNKATHLLERIEADEVFDVHQYGDRSTISNKLTNILALEIEHLLGAQAMLAIEQADPNIWFGPVRTPLGYHLFRLNKKQGGSLMKLDHRYSYILNEWHSDLVADSKNQLYQKYRENFTVTVDKGNQKGGSL